MIPKACFGHSYSKDGVASLAYDPGWEAASENIMLKHGERVAIRRHCLIVLKNF